MAIEKRLKDIPPHVLTANGTSNGRVTVADTKPFKVKQQVVLSSTASKDRFEVKRVENQTTLYVGPIGGKITDRSDISAFTTALSSTIEAQEQPRPNVPEQEIERLTYEEEPTVARRVILVDPYGNLIDGDNPLPVDAVINIESLSVDIDAKDGDNIAISGHEFPIFAEAADAITTSGYEEIFSYTSLDAGTRISYIDVAISTTANFLVKINGTTIREHRTSPMSRNAQIHFEEHRPLPLGAVLTVEVQPERLILASYSTFTAMEGYIA